MAKASGKLRVGVTIDRPYLWHTVAATFMAFCIGVAGTHVAHISGAVEPWHLTEILYALGLPLVKLFGCLFFFGRAWTVARIPSNAEYKINWGRLDWKQMLVTGFMEKYISLALTMAALAFVGSLVPDVLTAVLYFREN